MPKPVGRFARERLARAVAMAERAKLVAGRNGPTLVKDRRRVPIDWALIQRIPTTVTATSQKIAKI